MSFSIQKVRSVSLGLFVFFVVCDQSIKYVIAQYTTIHTTCNPGMALGVTLPPVVFWVVWLGVMAVVLYGFFTQRSARLSTHISFIGILAGGVSNIIDRLAYGCVIDYVPFLTISYFNFADVLITVGVILWMIDTFFGETKR